MSGGFWDRFARVYDLAETANRDVLRRAAERVGALVPAGARVLDCAAGTGAFSLAASAQAGEVLCTDLSLPMLERAMRKAARMGAGNIRFAFRDLTALPDPDGAYGAVIAANILHLLPDPAQAVRELWRVTAPGGRLILPTFLQGEVQAGFQAVIRLVQRMGFRYESAFTASTYRDFLAGLALAPVALEVIPGRVPEGIAALEKPVL